VHAGRVAIEHLHAIHADVPFAAGRVLGEHQRQGDEPPGVARPAGQHRQFVQVHRVAFLDHLLAGPARNDARGEPGQLGQGRQLFQLLDESNGDFRLNHLLDACGDGLEVAQGDPHSFHRAEGVDQHGQFRTGDIGEQQRRPAGLGHAVGDVRNLQVARNGRVDPAKLPQPVKLVDEFS